MRSKRISILAASLLMSVLFVCAHSRQIQELEVEKRCRIHGITLEKGEAPISYGMPVVDNVYEKARLKKFPNANSRIEGGCEVSADSPKIQSVFFCPQCRVAESEWAVKRRKRNSR